MGTPDATYLSRLRSILVNDPDLQGFRQELTELPEVWMLLVATEPSLERVAAAPLLQGLADWITSDNSSALPFAEATTGNTLLAVLTVLAHILEYMSYLKHGQLTDGEGDAHLDALKGVRDGGIQGLCIGLLSATALACSQTRAEVARHGAIAIRLALCVGAFIDLDDVQASEPTLCVSARWSPAEGDRGREKFEDVLDSYPQAYVAVTTDLSTATITAPKSVGMPLIRRLEEKGIATKQLDLRGRYHHPHHEMAFKKLVDLCAAVPMFRFPKGRLPLVPLRRNDSGKVVTDEMPLHEMALWCILVKQADWHATMTWSVAAMAQEATELPKSKRRALLLGPVDCVPRSLPLRLIRPVAAMPYDYPDQAIAIVGASCRFPGSESLPQFWDTIRTGKSTAGGPPGERGYPERKSNDEEPEAFRGNYLETAGSFDHSFFRKSPREALYMDPQHRIALELAYEALESAEYFGPGGAASDDVGCFVGVSSSDYADNVSARAPTAFSFTGTARAFAAGRISHFFGWTGPALVVDTACSSSAVAVHMACKAVQSGECAMALAGGVNVMASPRSHQDLGGAAFLSASGGQCRPFDAAADGYCRSEGGGFVLLKRLSAAVADGDRVLGVLAASAVNTNKGSSAITVPSAASQSALYRRVLATAGMHPLHVSYVEAHGTGTQRGDPVECESIRAVFGAPRRASSLPPLRLASVKGNIGHSEAASGVAALVKVLLMLQHRQIPPQASFAVPNPALSLDSAAMEIPQQLQPWHEAFRAACVNNYGASGSNAAMVVCQPPPAQPVTASLPAGVLKYPFLIAAHSADSLRRQCRALADFVEAQHAADGASLLASIAFHLAQRQNPRLRHRRTFAAQSIEELKACLDSPDDAALQAPDSPKPVVLLFAGQTGHRVRLSEEAWRSSLLLQHHLARCDRALQAAGLHSLFPRIFGTEPIEDLADVHCMLFALQYASARSWLDAGLQVKKLVGHSLGQLTALCVAGALSLDDAVKMISGRAALIQRRWGAERGCMLSVAADAATVQALAAQSHSSVEVACYNSPSDHVVVGPDAAVAAFEEATRSSGHCVKRLAITHGFHSQMVDSIMDDYRALLQGLEFLPAAIPIEACSKTDGSSWATVTPDMVAQQSRDPVYFADAIARVDEELGSCIWLEAGSGSAAVSMARRTLAKSGSPSSHRFYTVGLHGPEPTQSLADMTLGLWNEGVRVQFWPFHPSQRSCFASLELPSYQFQKTHHWLEYMHRHEELTRPNCQEQPQESPKLLSFSGYGDAQTAEFTINQHSDEYSALVRGRTVLGHTLSPASTWLESAARAIAILSGSPANLSLDVEQLKLHAPFGLDPRRRLRLTLQKHSHCSWKFAVSSNALDDDDEHVRLQASGIIKLPEPGRAPTFEPLILRLVDYERCLRLRQDPEASAVHGAFVKKVLGRVAIYSDAYFGIQSVTSRGLEAVGDVTMPEIASQGHAGTALNPPTFDNFLLVAELHAGVLGACQSDKIYICNGIDAIIPQAGCGDQEGPWTVYSKLNPKSDATVLSDIFVFNARQKTLFLAILGASFSAVPETSLKKALEAMNGNEKKLMDVCSSFVDPEALPTTPKPRAQETSCSAESSLAFEVHATVKALLHEVTGVSCERTDQSLSDLGVDSLSAIELQARIKDTFSAEIPVRQYFDQDKSFDSLCQEICSTLHPRPAVVSPVPQLCLSEAEDSSGPPTTPPSVGTFDQEPIAVRLSNLLAEHLSCPDGISLDMPLGDMGMDSLVAIQLKSDMESMFGKRPKLLEIDERCTFSDLLDIIGREDTTGQLTRGLATTTMTNSKAIVSAQRNHYSTSIDSNTVSPSVSSQPHFILQALAEFGHIKKNYVQFARQTGWAGFFSDVHPAQDSLALAYVSEGFSALGCDLHALPAGAVLPPIPHLPKHARLVSVLLDFVCDAGLAIRSGDGSGGSSLVVRTAVPAPSATAASLQAAILAAFPRYAPEHSLLAVTGPRLAACLTGAADALQLLFDSAQARALLEDVYVSSPLFATGTAMLRAFLQRVLQNRKQQQQGTQQSEQQQQPLRILEVGAGTGGTTHALLEELLLASSSSPSSGEEEPPSFRYIFTDISVALVSASKRRFQARYGASVVERHMDFSVLDIEAETLPAHLLGACDLVVSSNCIHATRSLPHSCRNLYRLLRPGGGTLCLLELTRPLRWLDCVFGLLDGWWRFDDARDYVLANEEHWRTQLLEAGFGRVEWSGSGNCIEEKVFRLILGAKI
ncbi:Non-reducing polyketide synthase andM [Lasiodiplodia hormozganensis]|uniref:Non-reducing polyketide synthase andM n=1 Tax=Lasiodiplodia hormozganensis TaxID=869390 RepID=A0AA39Y382_9PEZI|nr:Non-reducing polyketide synthase andM [Lasiodiplodia hormozganensis]